MTSRILVIVLSAFVVYALAIFGSGCAQIGFPTGGDRDSIPPRLVRADPAPKSLNVKSGRITLVFDEYIDIQELQNNLLISPVQKNNPAITFNLRTINIRFKDSLLPNTTYSINFGEAIRDINETNKLRDFTYVFSTGNTIDSLTLDGKVTLAETGKIDSTLQVLLYRDANDSAVYKRKPNYISRLTGTGSFHFDNLPAGNFKIYALKDGDGGKTYNSPTEIFAFTSGDIIVGIENPPVDLFAYALEKPRESLPASGRIVPEKRLRYTSNLQDNTQTLLDSLELSFNNKLTGFELTRLKLSDTNFVPINAYIGIDSPKKKVLIAHTWKPDSSYVLVVPKEAFKDTAGNTLMRNDTLRFKARKMEDYGRVLLRFPGLDLDRNPVIQFVQNETIILSSPITTSEWSNRLFPPGEYEIRILFDENKNGVWDPGNYTLKKQPEKAITLPQKLAVRADWDNERDISL